MIMLYMQLFLFPLKTNSIAIEMVMENKHLQENRFSYLVREKKNGGKHFSLGFMLQLQLLIMIRIKRRATKAKNTLWNK